MNITIRRIHWALLSGVTFALGILIGTLTAYLAQVFYAVGGGIFAILMVISFGVMGGVLFCISHDAFEQVIKKGNES